MYCLCILDGFFLDYDERDFSTGKVFVSGRR